MMQQEHSTNLTDGSLGVYMAYLLRYAKYPLTVTQLHKMAVTKHFGRLAGYLNELPPDTTYQSPKEALEHFKQINLHNQ